MKKILSLLALIAFCSCNNDDDSLDTIPDDSLNIESYYALYGNYTRTIYPDTNSDNLVKFQYDSQGRVIKRFGDILYSSPNSAYGPVISDSLFTDLVYFDNKVKLTKGISYLGYSTAENESIITLDSQNRMIKKTNRYQTNSGNIEIDTINFTHYNNKLTKYIKTSNTSNAEFDIRHFEESTLYYNINENLDSIVTIAYIKYSDTPYVVLKNKKTKIFENYDTSSNPFKELKIFEETFYRSLSRNNYKTYKEKSNTYYYPDLDFYAEPIMTPTTIDKVINWNFNYNANGNWLYNQP